MRGPRLTEKLGRGYRVGWVGVYASTQVSRARILYRSPVRPFAGRDLSRSQLDVLFLVAHSADPVTAPVFAGLQRA